MQTKTKQTPKHWDGTEFNECERLLASAPELLEALKLSKRYMEAIIESKESKNQIHVMNAIAVINKAIAEAEG